ncbi:MAG: hypothetical protein ACM357_02280 [Gemmatimonadota bacterium]
MRRRGHPVRRMLTSVVLTPLLFVVLYYGWLAVSAWRAGYAWEEMDWNDDGATTIREFFATNGVGRRPITREGRMCVEFFRLEDGLPLKTSCPDAP